MATAFVFGVARLEVAAVIGGEEDDGIVEHIQADQSINQAAERFVQPLDHAQVAGHLLMGRAAQRRQIRRHPARAVTFVVADRRRIIVAVVLMMRLNEGTEEEERTILMRVDISDHGVGLRVDAIAGQLTGRAVAIVHDGVVGIGGEFQQVGSQPVIVAAALLWRDRSLAFIRQVPFADVSGVVAGILEAMGQGAAFARQGDAIAVAAGFGGVQAGLQAGARRSANRLAGDGIMDVRAGASQAVEVGTEVKRIAVDAGCVPALLIGEEDDDVWGFCHDCAPCL